MTDTPDTPVTPTAETPVVETPAADAKPKLEQTITVGDAGPARKSITIEIPAARIEAKLKENMGKLKTDASIPGFRRGRAPMRLIEKRFGDTLREDVRGQLISESYSQAVEEQKLEVLGEPEVKDIDKLKLPDSGPMTVVVEVEVVPNFELPDLTGVAIQKPRLEVTDAQVQEEVKNLQKRYGKMNPVTEGGALAEDFVLVDLRILEGENAQADATEIAHHPGTYVLVTGEEQQFKGQVAGIAIDDLGKTMADKKVGDVITLSITGPAGHEDERIANKPVTLMLRVDKIERIELTPVDDVAKQMGMENAEALSTRIKEVLQSRNERSQKQAMHQQLTALLLEKLPMELPSNLSKRQTARLLHRQAVDMAMQGVPETDIAQKIAEAKAGSEEQAARQLKLFFILDRLARKHNIDVTENEVNQAIYMVAMQQGRRPEKLRQQMQRSGQIEQVYLEIRDTKTLDKVLETATISEVEKVETAK